MIAKDIDLDIAVAEGIISRDQALQLHDLSVRDLSTADVAIDFSQNTRDEPFRLLRGFRDFFIAVSVIIFAVGLWAVAFPLIKDIAFASGNSVRVRNGSAGSILIALILCVVGFVQAELITRKQRLPLSSLFVSIAFASWCALLFGLIATQLVLGATRFTAVTFQTIKWVALWTSTAGAVVSVAFFYWRYRLPFALLLLAASFVGLSLQIVRDVMGDPWFAVHERLLIGAWGGIIFAVAMWFDMKDRLRVSRLSECAFWLHLFAAPMLVHTLLLGQPQGSPSLGFVLGTMAVLSTIALLIDRRALLVSGLSYFAVAIWRLVSSSTLFGHQEFASTALILGGLMLALGLCWSPIRRAVLALLPFNALKSRLPPAVA